MQSSELIQRAIMEYCSRANTDYAIGIKGYWGTGKTYFWKKCIEPALTRKEYPSLHISLYGASSSADVDSAVYVAMSMFGGDDNDNILANLLKSNTDYIENLKIGGIGLVVQAGLKMWKDTKIAESHSILLCFDDLERADNVEACLGYINRLCEQSHTKVVVISSIPG